MTKATGKRTLRIVAAGAGVLLLAALVVAWLTGWPPDGLDRETVARWVAGAGPWGPLAVIGLMTAAVVASPLPSAPIALAAGAAYGHYAGAAYVALGSELGAVSAFLIARGAGRGVVERMLGDKRDYGLLGSQNALTLTVFVSRLLPFVSFDAMSYAAGLSRLHFWRFALATQAGILPASFVLAHFGSVAVEGDFGTAEWIILGLGLLTAVPLVLMALRGGTGASQRQTEQTQHKEHIG